MANADIEQVQHVKKTLYPPRRMLSDDTPRLRGGAPMASVLVERWDHVGWIAAVIND